jgi:endonuclease III
MAKALKASEARARVKVFGPLLDREFPEAKCALHHETPAQLLFATILSAQCTDVRVNLVTPSLFARYPDPASMAKARVASVEKLIKSINFFRNKAKNLVEAAKILVRDHEGKVPGNMEALVELPGVGRKTANVVLGDAFQAPVGVVVDTHVKRISQLLGLTEESDPVKIEIELMEIVPREWWVKFSHWLILHGRTTCIARRPRCESCVIRASCEYGRKHHETIL